MSKYELVRQLDDLGRECTGCALWIGYCRGFDEHTNFDDGCNKDDGHYIWQLAPDEQPTDEAINHPTHYNWLPSNVEAEDICEHFPWRIGAAIKYLYRHQHKHDDRGIQDLKKAVNQIQKHIKLLEGDYVQYERTNERL